MHDMIAEYRVDLYLCQHSIVMSLVMSWPTSSSSHCQVIVKSSTQSSASPFSRHRQVILTSQPCHRHNILQSRQSHVRTVLLDFGLLQGIDYTFIWYLWHYVQSVYLFDTYILPSTYCRFSWSIMTAYKLHICLRYYYSAQRILYLWYYYYTGQSVDLCEI